MVVNFTSSQWTVNKSGPQHTFPCDWRTTLFSTYLRVILPSIHTSCASARRILRCGSQTLLGGVEGLPDLRRDKLLVLHLTLLLYLLFVRVEGLEPPSLAALDPKSSVSTNFTTPAFSKQSANIIRTLSLRKLSAHFII